MLRRRPTSVTYRGPLQGGWTVLHFAAYYNHADVLTTLMGDFRVKTRVKKLTGVRAQPPTTPFTFKS